MLIGAKKNIRLEEEGEEEEEGKIVYRIRMGGESWRIVGIHVNGDMDRKLERFKGWMEEGKK